MFVFIFSYNYYRQETFLDTVWTLFFSLYLRRDPILLWSLSPSQDSPNLKIKKVSLYSLEHISISSLLVTRRWPRAISSNTLRIVRTFLIESLDPCFSPMSSSLQNNPTRMYPTHSLNKSKRGRPHSKNVRTVFPNWKDCWLTWIGLVLCCLRTLWNGIVYRISNHSKTIWLLPRIPSSSVSNDCMISWDWKYLKRAFTSLWSLLRPCPPKANTSCFR